MPFMPYNYVKLNVAIRDGNMCIKYGFPYILSLYLWRWAQVLWQPWSFVWLSIRFSLLPIVNNVVDTSCFLSLNDGSIIYGCVYLLVFDILFLYIIHLITMNHLRKIVFQLSYVPVYFFGNLFCWEIVLLSLGNHKYQKMNS